MRRLLPFLFLLGSAQAAQLTVFAASSLTDAFTELGRVFDARTGHRTRFNFAGSQVLRTQLEQGARADVFASANAAQYAPLVAAGRVEPGQTFARNRLVVIAPANNRAVQKLSDLTRPGLKLVLAAQGVPAGDATRAALSSLDRAGTYGGDFSRRVLAGVVSEEPNVRQVALKVGLGQADAAFVYRSDVTPRLKAAVRVIELPARFNPPVAYPIGAVRGGNREAAHAFITFVRSAQGQGILKKWGLLGAP
ncbi:MAG: molybdate ABC transporter substrate-binding protein [Deinococcus sp.]|uniref:molybdate ABC transporter substrate-binding protein n=1 Tax=Deinococcus sp. TaxID=47478 RepID=UPI0026DD5C18|nr:molybdate ABC transporter substrate-binding protein [Deinococcus sp.]MDO4245927.1 molybdate ABC transporter substrate-binding protein [Deinococcus sp.]